jgi:hypothetical protein
LQRPLPGKGERAVVFSMDEVGSLPAVLPLPFVEPISNHQASSSSERMSKRRVFGNHQASSSSERMSKRRVFGYLSHCHDKPRNGLNALKSRLGWSHDRSRTSLTPEDEQALRIALDDPENDVRIQAIQAIRDLRPSSFLGVLEQMRRSEMDPLVQSNLDKAMSAIRAGSR